MVSLNLSQIISLHLQDLSNEEAFERGVSALGHFSILCPSSLKAQVEKLCVSVVSQHPLKLNFEFLMKTILFFFTYVNLFS